jgi:small subunit ribosomal protein S10
MKLRIILKSFNKKLIQNSLKELKLNLITEKFNVLNIISLPIKIKRFCLLRSPHVDKKSREHFELKFYKVFLDVEFNKISSINLLLKKELPSGVSYSINNLLFN